MMQPDREPSLPLVSIGIPTFNRASQLEGALASAAAQTYPQLEIVISDNASTDATPELCARWAERDRRIRYRRSPENRGPIANFRQVLEAATGDYFLWLGDDDWLEAHYVEHCLRELVANPDYALVAGQVQYVLADGSTSDRRNLTIMDGTGEQRVLAYYATVTDNGIFYGLMRRSVLSQIPFQRVMGWDWLLLSSIAFTGKLAGVDSTYIKRSFSCLDNPVLGYQRIAQRDNLGEFHGRYPHLSIALSAFTNIAHQSPVYADLDLEARLALAGQVQRILCQRHRMTLSPCLLELLTALDWATKQPENTAALADLEQKQAAVRAQGWEVAAQQLTDLYTGRVSAIATVNRDRTQPLATPRIAIDGVFFQRYQTGIARVWTSLLAVWSKTALADHLLLLDRGGTAPRIDTIAACLVPPHDYADLEGDRQLLQDICDREGIDLFLSTYYTTPLSTPSVLMTYDMIPEALGANFQEPMWQEKHHAIRYASAYLAISQNTAADLAQYFPAIAVESVRVAHCGIDPQVFRPSSEIEIATFFAKYGIERPYFLLSGPGLGYKNAELFFQALAQLCSASGFAVVCTGTHGFLDPRLRELAPVSFLYPLQLGDEELCAAYSGAIALVYPSLYEGFGLPVLEAMACGCPVITTPKASLPEVAGEAAIYVGDRDVAALVEALCEVQKPGVRQSLIQKGLARAQQFSWSRMADQVAEVLIETTLQDLNLQAENWIAFPDWTQPEAELAAALGALLPQLTARERPLTLLLANSQLEPEAASLMLTGIVMAALWSEALEIPEHLHVAVVNPLSALQLTWLRSRLTGRWPLKRESAAAIAQFHGQDLPRVSPETLEP